MTEYIEEDSLKEFPELAKDLKLLPICLEFHKLPSELKKEDIATIDFLGTSLKIIGNKRKMEAEKQKFLAEQKRR